MTPELYYITSHYVQYLVSSTPFHLPSQYEPFFICSIRGGYACFACINARDFFIFNSTLRLAFMQKKKLDNSSFINAKSLIVRRGFMFWVLCGLLLLFMTFHPWFKNYWRIIGTIFWHFT
ncbi:hypothetical protein BC749_101303 [Flavobacterium araucananum]|nr:hypothetical protein BC749_101303 [Flavobacterium araucananum]